MLLQSRLFFKFKLKMTVWGVKVEIKLIVSKTTCKIWDKTSRASVSRQWQWIFSITWVWIFKLERAHSLRYLFIYLGRAHVVSFWAHVNLPYHIVSYHKGACWNIFVKRLVVKRIAKLHQSSTRTNHKHHLNGRHKFSETTRLNLSVDL